MIIPNTSALRDLSEGTTTRKLLAILPPFKAISVIDTT